LATNYKQLAEQEVNPQVNERINQLKANLANKLVGIDQGFEANKAERNLMNVKSQNAISNNALGRGLSQSSIVTTGLGEADQINNRLVGNLKSNAEAQKLSLSNGVNDQVLGLEQDKTDKINSLARQLEDRDWERNYKMKQLQLKSNPSSSPKGNPIADIDEVIKDGESSYGAKINALSEANNYYRSIGDIKSADYAYNQLNKLRSDYTVNTYSGYGQSAGANRVVAPVVPIQQTQQTISTPKISSWISGIQSEVQNAMNQPKKPSMTVGSALKSLYNKIVESNQAQYKK
jgi:hypothetical protein